MITDTRTFPLRTGGMGVGIGYAGFKGVEDYRGGKDIFDRQFHSSQINLTDGLATATNITMGEGSQQQPLATIKGAPVTFVNRIDKDELKIDIRTDLYKPLYLKIDKLMRNKT
ncbi:MAG: coenzyme F420-0:L-glutamate ligase [Patescibacteria group bacterium]